MPRYLDEAADMIRRLVRRNGDEMLDAAGDAAALSRNAPPPRMQWELPMDVSAPPRTPSFEGLDGVTAPPPVDLSLESPAFADLSRSADRYLQMRRGQSANLRNQPFNGVAGQAIRDAAAARQAQIAADARMGQIAQTAAGVGVGAAAVGGMLAGGGRRPAPASADITSTDGTAELANESRPAPQVPAEPAAKARPAPAEEPDVAASESAAVKRNLLRREMQRADAGEGAYDPRHQAQVILKDLNNRRMKAGGEVPESREMLAQINELVGKSDQRSNARSAPQAQAYAKNNPSDPHAQASALIAQLNDMRRRAGGEVPQAPQIMAEVRRLQAMGDQQRNAQTTARR